MQTTQITLTFEGVPSPADIAARLRMQAAMLDGTDAKTAASRKTTEKVNAATDNDEDFNPKPAKKTKAAAAAASFEDEDDAPVEAAAADEDVEEVEEDFTTPPAKKAKAKKITVDDVNDACKARAAQTGGKAGREEVLAILKKNFKTTSVSELKPEQYQKAIEAMQA